MGNMFLGFPVPRAKIADMIATNAPPTIHKVNHQSGGSDELNVTGLVGAGGASLPFPDFLWSFFMEGLDGISDSTFSGGAVTVGDTFIQLDSDGTEYSLGAIKKDPLFQQVPLTWAKNRQFNTCVQFRAFAVADSEFIVATGDPFYGDGFGFAVVDGFLKAVCRDGSSQSTHTIEDWSAAVFTETRRLRAHKTGAAEIEFYVDDVLVHTETSNVPSGSSDAEVIMQVSCYNSAAGSALWIKISSYTFWQEA